MTRLEQFKVILDERNTQRLVCLRLEAVMLQALLNIRNHRPSLEKAEHAVTEVVAVAPGPKPEPKRCPAQGCGVIIHGNAHHCTVHARQLMFGDTRAT